MASRPIGLVGAALLSLLGSCSHATTEPSNGGWELDPGILLNPNSPEYPGAWGEVAWNADGTYIVYERAISGTLEATRWADGVGRPVDERKLSRSGLFRAAGGGFYEGANATDTASGREVWHYELNGQRNLVLDELVYEFAISADELAIAYSKVSPAVGAGTATADSMFQRRCWFASCVGTESRFLGLAAPVAFSPDGTMLAAEGRPCVQLGWPNPCSAFVVTLSTGERRAITLGNRSDGVQRVRWDGAGLWILAVTNSTPPDSIFIREVMTGTTTVLAVFDPADQTGPALSTQAAWSGDRSHVAWWSFHPGPKLWALYVASQAAGTPRRLAVTGGRPVGLAFSPDGRQLAYLNMGRLYRVPL
jgi:hypothetical protein